MSDPIKNLKSYVATQPGGCTDCRHLWGKTIVTPGYLRCLYHGGNDARQVRIQICKGDNWSPKGERLSWWKRR